MSCNLQALKVILVLVILTIISSCANYDLHYTKEAVSWPEKTTDPVLKIDHTVYLVGDAGNYPTVDENPTLKLLQKQLTAASKNSSVIFLGDNIYPEGFPTESEEPDKKKLAIDKLNAQLTVLENFNGRPYFISGNHDWAGDGVLGIRRQEAYIEEYLNTKKGIADEDDWDNYFLPDNGCGDPTVVEVNDQLVIIFIDSNWYLKDWDKEHPTLNEGCEALSRPVFRFLFEELARKYKNKNVIIASHHPLYTYGPHGGKSSLKEHIFPLTQFSDGLYVPVPVLGTVAVAGRALLGSRQDVANPIYKRFKDDLLAGASKNGSYIFASGHEHNLQYIELEKQKYIVSGAASKKSPVTLGNGSKFSYGGKGFSKIDFYEDGSAWLTFYRAKEDGSEEVLYKQKIKDKLLISKDNIPASFPEYEANNATILRKPTLIETKPRGKLYDAFLGHHYRDLYINEFKFPVLDLKDFEGGALPIKRGGGNQTNSLRLKTTDGRQFAMRALTKDGTRVLPYPLNKMYVASAVLEENFMSTHPFVPLVVPKLADAVNVYHTNPQLYYVPKQPDLGVQNDLFGGDVYLIEERPSKGHEDVKSFGHAEKFYSSHDVAKKIRKNENHIVDQNWVIRSRLFDMLIGDWDRHDDQWRWHMHKEGDKHIYRPIPRDRDQAFSKYDGFVSWAARIFTPFLKQAKVYDSEIKNNTRWDNWSSRFFNMTFLNQISWEEWEKEASFIKENMTDEIIEEAFKAMPAFAQEDSGEELKIKLKKRRDDVLKYARQFYEFYADEMVVLGTDKKDKFEVTRMADGKTLVEVFRKKNKTYSRVFDKRITKEIHLYGLGGDDKFTLDGKSKKSSLIRVIGGAGEDTVEDKSTVAGPSKKTKVYDAIGGIKIEPSKEAKDKTSDYKLINYFDRRDVQYEHDFQSSVPFIAFNQDDGFIFGGATRLINYKFKKYPYAQEHNLSANFSTSTKAIAVIGSSEFIEVLGRWDLTFDLNAHGARNTFNYFGYGNNTGQNADDQFFNQVRVSQGIFDAGIRKRFANNSAYFKFFARGEWADVQRTDGRFVVEPDNGLPNDIYESKLYVGAGIELDYSNLDNFADPKQGIKFNVKNIWRGKTEDLDDSFSNLNSHAVFYIPLDRKQNLVFATRAGVGVNWGDNYEFYHGQSIGGEFLRGFRNERFLGDVAFYHNNDLRLKILSSKNKVLPFTFGISAGFDYGKVWVENKELSKEDKLHLGYGGAIWMAPIDLFIISLGYYASEDDTRIILNLGHSF